MPGRPGPQEQLAEQLGIQEEQLQQLVIDEALEQDFSSQDQREILSQDDFDQLSVFNIPEELPQYRPVSSPKNVKEDSSSTILEEDLAKDIDQYDSETDIGSDYPDSVIFNYDNEYDMSDDDSNYSTEEEIDPDVTVATVKPDTRIEFSEEKLVTLLPEISLDISAEDFDGDEDTSLIPHLSVEEIDPDVAVATVKPDNTIEFSEEKLVSLQPEISLNISAEDYDVDEDTSLIPDLSVDKSAESVEDDVLDETTTTPAIAFPVDSGLLPLDIIDEPNDKSEGSGLEIPDFDDLDVAVENAIVGNDDNVVGNLVATPDYYDIPKAPVPITNNGFTPDYSDYGPPRTIQSFMSSDSPMTKTLLDKIPVVQANVPTMIPMNALFHQIPLEGTILPEMERFNSFQPSSDMFMIQNFQNNFDINNPFDPISPLYQTNFLNTPAGVRTAPGNLRLESPSEQLVPAPPPRKHSNEDLYVFRPQPDNTHIISPHAIDGQLLIKGSSKNVNVTYQFFFGGGGGSILLRYLFFGNFY